VLASDNPLTFHLDDQIAVINSHATEVVVDDAGEWWVSHCGWGEGGVYLAPLSWRP
jgi:beta-fructofuranosidase